MKNNDFDIKNLPIECQDSSIKQEDFTLVNNDERIHEQKFETKPTTFLKDCLKRFKKNKSSVAAAVILGLLLALSVVVPIVDQNDIKNPHPYATYLQPKLFDSGTGFWDGTRKFHNIPVDTGENGFNETDKDKNWWPNPERFKHNAVMKKEFSSVEYTSGESQYGKEGYVHFGYYYTLDKDFVEFKTRPITARKENVPDDTIFELQPTDLIYLNTLDTYNLEKLIQLEGSKDGVEFPENYEQGKISLWFTYELLDEHDKIILDEDNKPKTNSFELIPEQEVFDIGSKVASRKKDAVELTELIRKETTDVKFNNAQFSFRMKNQGNRRNTCTLIRAIEFDAQLSNKLFEEAVEITNFTDATECVIRKLTEPNSSITNRAYWISTGVKNVHMSKIVYCSFVYDSYEAAFGTMTYELFPIAKLKEYAKQGWIDWKVYTEDDPGTGTYHITANSKWAVKDKENSPVVEFEKVECDEDTGEIFVTVKLCYYKFYGYERMPKFLLGTDKSGHDMLKYVFEGLRTSLILGIFTFVICFLFGLFYGSVSGYFGGAVDLVMERFTDILAGVPWIVVMTLIIIKFGSTFWTFLAALCMTGWIGTASTARTQFYRFRGREYVLASRTLGASDARLIAKHILPNAMGTIITGAVLMIPSVIFSEATISYLGLGLKNLSSLGVILSNNQSQLTTNPYLLVFPSVVIALLMISFNLFGNGLRDAVNPSLKGEDE